jgi:3-deoxy-D-manno-octulosonic-acid transferase
MILFFYNVALLVALTVGAPWWLYRMATTEKYREGLGQRLGRVSLRKPDRPLIWIHAVSVGEVLAVSGLVKALDTSLPEYFVAISTTTRTGQALARERFGDERVFYCPLDLPWAVGAWLNALQPSLVVLAETEFWPNLLSGCFRRGIPVAVVNARVSDRSWPRYRRLRWLWRPFLERLDKVLAQSETDAERLLAIGCGDDRVSVAGNVKFDVRAAEESEAARILKALRFGSRVVVAGSTLEGEEAALLEAWPRLLEADPRLVLVLAPRHPERFDAVDAILEDSGMIWTRRTDWREKRAGTVKMLKPGQVVLLDTIGELASVYSVASVAFVGGSLVAAGGHNPLEPAQFGVPIVMGPHYANFREITEDLRRHDAIRIVEGDGLAGVLGELLADRSEAAAMGGRAKQVFEQQAGATARCMEALRELLHVETGHEAAKVETREVEIGELEVSRVAGAVESAGAFEAAVMIPAEDSLTAEEAVEPTSSAASSAAEENLPPILPTAVEASVTEINVATEPKVAPREASGSDEPPASDEVGAPDESGATRPSPSAAAAVRAEELPAWRRLLVPAVPAYRLALWVRERRLGTRAEPVRRLRFPVVSIGNLSTGGAGKTPFTIALAKLLTQRGLQVDVLSRGYGRRSDGVVRVSAHGTAEEFGDEPVLIAREAGVPVYVAGERFDAGVLAEGDATALAVVDDQQRAVVHLLDDGFQHRQLARNVDVLLLDRRDWTDGLLPAGNLREPIEAARRAAVIAIPAEDGELETELRGWGWAGPVWRVTRRMEVPAAGGAVAAFCGIARPAQFFAGLEAEGLQVIVRKTFADHQPYKAADVQKLVAEARAAGAKALLTTEKDRVRLDDLAAGFPADLPLLAAGLRVEIDGGDVAWLMERLGVSA